MGQLSLTKKALRSVMKKHLADISGETITYQSNQVFNALKTFQPYADAKHISVYLSMPGGEIQTDAIVHHALEAGKHVFVPYLHKPVSTSPDEPVRVMDMVRLHNIEDYQSLSQDRWGIPSIDPATVSERDRVLGQPAGSGTGATLDLILVPGIAFDTNPAGGEIRRLGHGKGFYDRFLHHYSSTPQALKRPPMVVYGLALTQQYLDWDSDMAVPVGPHDRTLNGLILGDGSIRVNVKG